MGCIFVIFSFTMSNHGWCFKRTAACNERVFLSVFNTFITVHLLIFVVKPRPHFAPPLMEFSGFIFFDRILGFSVFYLYMCFVQICLNFVQICLKFSTVRTWFWHRSNGVWESFERFFSYLNTISIRYVFPKRVTNADKKKEKLCVLISETQMMLFANAFKN